MLVGYLDVTNRRWITTVDFTSLRTCVSVMRVCKREACAESCSNNLITRTLTLHARSKRSEINSTRGGCTVCVDLAKSERKAVHMNVIMSGLPIQVE